MLIGQLRFSRGHDVIGEPTLPTVKGTRRRAGPLCGVRGRAATSLTKPRQPATLATPAAGRPCRPASSESVAPFDRTRWPAPAAGFIGMGIMTPMLRIGREKLGQTRSLIASSSDANLCVSHDKV